MFSAIFSYFFKKEESKDIQKEESKDIQKEESKEESKEELKEESKEELKEESKEELKDDSNAVPTNHLLNLFNKTHRGMLYEDLDELLQKSYLESPMYTLKCIAHIRDINGGRGERDLSKKAYRWLEKWHENQLIMNMDKFIKKYGRWDDLIYLPLRSKSSTHYLSLMSKQLTADLENMKNGTPASKVAKWVPSEKSNGHNHAEINAELAKIMGMDSGKLRKTYLTPLRKHIFEMKQPEDNSDYNHEDKFNYSFDEMMDILSDSRYDDILVSI